ncbi:MAG: hypothetical protein GWO79_01030 [Actinobacteria bacterium]|nr:hypothetical protein [Actinomycetota bacterium]
MQDKKAFKKLAYSYAAYSGASVFGPMLVLGGLGYAFDRFFGTKFIVFIGVAIAFVATNILIYRKTKKLSETMSETSKKEKEEKKREEREKSE